MPDTTIEGSSLQLFPYSPFQTKQGRFVLPSCLPFTSEFDLSMKCTLKRGVLCVVWGSSLEQVQSVSIQDGVIVQNTNTPLTAIVFNLSKEYVS